MERIEQFSTMSFNHIYGSWSFFNIKKKKKTKMYCHRDRHLPLSSPSGDENFLTLHKREIARENLF